MRASPALEQAYRTARYTVSIGRRRLDLAIGRADAEADEVLRRAGCRSHWCLLTPCNPGSRRWPAALNAQRLRRLRELVRHHGWRALPASNSAVDGRWREPGLCLFDVAPSVVQQFARRFGQTAWVFGAPGAPPRLVWTRVALSPADRDVRDRGPAQSGRGPAA